jgi:hypothetical protein
VTGTCDITSLFCWKLVVDGCNPRDCVVFLRASGAVPAGRRISLTHMIGILYSTRCQISQNVFHVESSKAIETSVSTITCPAYTHKANTCYFAIVHVLCYGRKYFLIGAKYSSSGRYASVRTVLLRPPDRFL